MRRKEEWHGPMFNRGHSKAYNKLQLTVLAATCGTKYSVILRLFNVVLNTELFFKAFEICILGRLSSYIGCELLYVHSDKI